MRVACSAGLAAIISMVALCSVAYGVSNSPSAPVWGGISSGPNEVAHTDVVPHASFADPSDKTTPSLRPRRMAPLRGGRAKICTNMLGVCTSDRGMGSTMMGLYDLQLSESTPTTTLFLRGGGKGGKKRKQESEEDEDEDEDDRGRKS